MSENTPVKKVSLANVDPHHESSARSAGSTPRQRLAAWAVHAFTMSGVVWASLAALSLINEQPKWMWFWLGVALVVDGLDGTFARAARVKEVVPWFDGSALDLVVDYLTWTFIPAVWMYQTIPFWSDPDSSLGMAVSGLLMAAVTTTSMFCYCNKSMKAQDNYFVGFPAAWNIVVLYLYLVDLNWAFNLFVVALFVVLTVSPLTFCHPFRVKRLRWVNIASVTVWFVCIIWLTVVFPARPLVVWVAFWVSGIWFIGVGVLRTFTGVEREQ